MSKEQTAVEYLIEQLSNYDSPMMELFEKEINQAKEMEKQQIIDAYDENENYMCFGSEGEQYYNEKFNN